MDPRTQRRVVVALVALLGVALVLTMIVAPGG